MKRSRYFDRYHSAIQYAAMCAPCKVSIMQDLNRHSLGWECGRISDDEFRSYLEGFCRKYDVRIDFPGDAH